MSGDKAVPGTAAQGMNLAKDGWFTESSTLWPGEGMSLKVKEVLHTSRSKFQDVCVFESESKGRVLTLDGVIQCTDHDEFSYQEMMVHIPMCGLANPASRVLIVGGGDGGVAREVARYTSVEKIEQAEIDEAVPETSKKFFPKMAVGFTDPRVQLCICDGIQYVKDAAPGTYDVIIVDSSDPVGPAEVLFERPFFEAMHRALKPGGVVCTQAESLWLHLDIIKAVAGMCHSVFEGGHIAYAYTTIPTYPSGMIGMMVCTKAGGAAAPTPRVPKQSVPEKAPHLDLPPLRYYTPELHSASFVLPRFAQEALAASLSS